MATTQPWVLIVDDEPAIRRTISVVLASEGYACRQAADGQEALAALESTPAAAVIVLDLLMPGMDGPAFLAERRQRAAIRDIPVIVISASREARTPDALEMLGVAAVFPKPFDIDELLAAIRKVIV